jgi:hypothetical protein
VFDQVIAGFPPPHLHEPLHPGSRLVRRVGVRCSELSGRPILWGPMIGTVCALSPGAVRLWLGFDGRTLAEILDEARREDAASDDRAVLEVIRSMRALGLVEDVHDDSDCAPYRDPADGSAFVTIHAMAIELDGSLVLRVPDPRIDGSKSEIRIDSSSCHESVTGAILRAVMIDDDDIDHAHRLLPIELLDRVLPTSDPRDFDGLIRVAEHVDGYATPVGSNAVDIIDLDD